MPFLLEAVCTSELFSSLFFWRLNRQSLAVIVGFNLDEMQHPDVLIWQWIEKRHRRPCANIPIDCGKCCARNDRASCSVGSRRRRKFWSKASICGISHAPSDMQRRDGSRSRPPCPVCGSAIGVWPTYQAAIEELRFAGEDFQREPWQI